MAIYELTKTTKTKLFLCCCVLVLTACQQQTRDTPVFERSIIDGNGRRGIQVHAGDTLYSLAWRLGVDYKALATANNIKPPYLIYPGQNIYSRAPQTVGKSNSRGVTKTGKVAKSKAVTSSNEKKSSHANKPNARKLPSGVISQWQWPLNGTVVRKFSSKSGGNQGIDIASQKAQPVRCAADGIVVYAGAGLRGYNNLVIVKHSELYLSAYANNKKIFVKEGEQVKAGQKFAEISSKSNETGTLHFEIRKQGKPVDPLSLLPKK